VLAGTKADNTRWPDEVAGGDRLREKISGRDGDRSIQIDHRTAAAGPLIRRSEDGSRHRLHRPPSHARLRTPEIRPLQNAYRVATASKREIRLNYDRCTNVATQRIVPSPFYFRITEDKANAVSVSRTPGSSAIDCQICRIRSASEDSTRTSRSKSPVMTSHATTSGIFRSA
jgi:hypothetical protein